MKHKIKDVKSACELYLRYVDDPELLFKEREDLFWEFVKDKNRVGNINFYFGNLMGDGVVVDDINEYNEWLFKLSFKPIFESDKK